MSTKLLFGITCVYVAGLLGFTYINSANSEPASQHSNVKERIVSAIAHPPFSSPRSDEPVIDPDPAPHIKTQDLKLVEGFAKGMGLNHVPKVIYTCEWSGTKFSAAFEAYTWRLGICRHKLETERGFKYRVFAIAHELGHAIDAEQGSVSSEMSADGRAIDYLASIGYWEAIRAKSEIADLDPTKDAYRPGSIYAKQVLSKAGKL